jgi:hypothetical protein
MRPRPPLGVPPRRALRRSYPRQEPDAVSPRSAEDAGTCRNARCGLAVNNGRLRAASPSSPTTGSGWPAQAARRVVEAVLKPSQWTIRFMTTTITVCTTASTSTARRRYRRGKRRERRHGDDCGAAGGAPCAEPDRGVGSIVRTGVPATATSHRAREGTSMMGSDATAEDAAFVGSATAGGRITYQ